MLSRPFEEGMFSGNGQEYNVDLTYRRKELVVRRIELSLGDGKHLCWRFAWHGIEPFYKFRRCVVRSRILTCEECDGSWR